MSQIAADTEWESTAYRRWLNDCIISVVGMSDGTWAVVGSRCASQDRLDETADSLSTAMAMAESWAEPEPVPDGLLDRTLALVRGEPA